MAAMIVDIAFPIGVTVSGSPSAPAHTSGSLEERPSRSGGSGLCRCRSYSQDLPRDGHCLLGCRHNILPVNFHGYRPVKKGHGNDKPVLPFDSLKNPLNAMERPGRDTYPRSGGQKGVRRDRQTGTDHRFDRLNLGLIDGNGGSAKTYDRPHARNL